MSLADKLQGVQGVDGYLAIGLFTPAGDVLASHVGKAGINIKDIGVLANNVLMNAQKASLDMGTGLGEQVHIEAEKAHILARCLNEGTDHLKSQPGKAHIHAVLIMGTNAPIGMAKMKLNQVVENLAEDFRL
jgi:hypothetical protein